MVAVRVGEELAQGSGHVRKLFGTLLWWAEERRLGSLRRERGSRFDLLGGEVLVVPCAVGFLVFVGPVCSWSFTKIGAVVVGVVEVGAAAARPGGGR